MEKLHAIPKTNTPENVYLILVITVVILAFIFTSFLGIWGAGILCILLGSLTSQYTESNVPAFSAGILVNSITGKMRVIFPGLNFKLPWEDSNNDEYINLRTELSETCSKNYTSLDSLMEAKFFYSIKPSANEEDIMAYSHFKPDVIKIKGEGLFSMLLSDYYAKHNGKELLNKETINKAIFGTEDRPSREIKDFKKEHGVEVVVMLISSNFDARVQKFRDSISAVDSIKTAMDILVKSGIDESQAEKFVKLMNFNGYKEKDINLTINYPRPKNLQ